MVETPAVAQFLELLQGPQVLAAGRSTKWIVLTLDSGWSERLPGLTSTVGSARTTSDSRQPVKRSFTAP
jgi:hypothetical protein